LNVKQSDTAIRWEYKALSDLSVTSLFEIYRLRQQVFVIEQQCIYEDIDAADKTALHVLGWIDDRGIGCASENASDATKYSMEDSTEENAEENTEENTEENHYPKEQPPILCAYLRIMGLENTAQTVSIGRVVIEMGSRRKGVGKQLLSTALDYIERIAPEATITVSAQHHLTDFYQVLGFCVVSDPYDEDGIPHVRMVKTLAR